LPSLSLPGRLVRDDFGSIVIASEAKQSSKKPGLLRRFAPRNDAEPSVPTAIVSAHGLLYRHSTLEGANMLALRLPPEIEQRLDALAKKTGRSKSDCAREAILRQIEDIEDYYLARRRLRGGGSRMTLESLERNCKKRTKRFR
jgi:RHH-type transcriptional regulator, rel operon repressor / antitoxin RelB